MIFYFINYYLLVFIERQIIHIERAILFAAKIGNGSLLVYYHMGISRSSAIALAKITKKLVVAKKMKLLKR